MRKGEIKHALRVTVKAGQTINAHVTPATHNPVTGNPCQQGDPITYLPMGARLRLKSTFSEAGYPAGSENPYPLYEEIRAYCC